MIVSKKRLALTLAMLLWLGIGGAALWTALTGVIPWYWILLLSSGM